MEWYNWLTWGVGVFITILTAILIPYIKSVNTAIKSVEKMIQAVENKSEKKIKLVDDRTDANLTKIRVLEKDIDMSKKMFENTIKQVFSSLERIEKKLDR